jgi:hypothetical protein
MTKIDKVLQKLSDLYEFNRKIKTYTLKEKANGFQRKQKAAPLKPGGYGRKYNLRIDNMDKVPRLKKDILKVTSLNDIEEEKKYWISKTPIERIEAIEINRRMIYGQDRVTSRLQRFFETSELS